MYSYVTLFRYIAKSNYWGEDTAHLTQRHNSRLVMCWCVYVLCVAGCMYGFSNVRLCLCMGVCMYEFLTCGCMYIWVL